MTPTGAERGVVTARIGQLIRECVTAHDLGLCCGFETGFILERDPETVRAPDATFVANRSISDSGEPAWSSCWNPRLRWSTSTKQIDMLGTADDLNDGDVLLGFRMPVQHLLPPDRPSR